MGIEQISFQIISYAGDSFAKMVEALRKAKGGDFDSSEKLMKEAKELLNMAHNVQTELLVAEAQGQKSEYSILMVHAQDTLMNSILAETLIQEMIDMYRAK